MPFYDNMLELIENDDLEECKKHYYSTHYTPVQNIDELNKSVFNKLNNKYPLYTSTEHANAIIHSIRKGKFDILKWLVCEIDNDLSILDYGRLFNISCLCHHFDISKWLYENNTEAIKSCKYVNEFEYRLFEEILYKEDLDFNDWFLDTFPDLIDSLDIETFSTLCYKKKLQSAIWLTNKRPDIIENMSSKHAYRKETIKEICVGGDLDMMKWFANLVKDEDEKYNELSDTSWINIDVSKVILECIINNQIEMSNYLVSLYPDFDSYPLDEKCFNKAILNGNIDLIEFMLSKNPNLESSLDYDTYFECLKFAPINYIDYLERNLLANAKKFTAGDLICLEIKYDCACRNKDFNVLKKMYEETDEEMNLLIEISEWFVVLEKTVSSNYIDSFIWLIDSGPLKNVEFDNQQIHKYFRDACQSYSFDIAKYISNRFNHLLDLKSFDFIDHSVYMTNDYPSYNDKDITLGLSILLSCITDECSIKNFKELFNLILDIDSTIPLLIRDQILFRWACICDNFNVAKYVLETFPTIHIDDSDDKILYDSVMEGANCIVEWLLNLKPDMYISFDTLVAALEGDNYHCARLLHLKNPNNMNHITSDIFQDIIFNKSHPRTIQLIIDNKPNLDITANNHKCFKFVCDNDNYKVAEIFVNKRPDIYSISFDEDGCIEYEINIQLILSYYMAVKDILNECPICYETIPDTITHCNHQFCYNCMKNHYKRNNNCPMCRQPINEKSIFKIYSQDEVSN